MFSHPEPRYRLDLEIAGISMRLHASQSWKEEAAFLPFQKETAAPDYTALFREVRELPALSAAVIHEDACYRVHPDGKGGYLRSFFDAPRDHTPYAVAEYDYANGRLRVDYLPKGAHCVSELHNSFFHLGFEAVLLHRDRLCLHAACVDTPIGGLLFSGPSGIGKSTQADLWQRCRDGKLINGDRPILSKDRGVWSAWGSPYAGSSGCHVNEKCAVAGIMLLQKARTCSLERLTPPEAFRGVWPGLIVHSWDKSYVEKAFALTMELITAVPVFRFNCTPELSAVEYLERELGKELRL